MLVAVTGRSGCGKSEVSQYYANCGYKVIDCDKISKQILSENEDIINKLSEVFGSDILDKNGKIIPNALGAKAFLEKDGAEKLTEITHPAIVARILNLTENCKNSIVFVDGAVIIGELFEKYCDKFIVVTARQSDCISRIVLRDGISRQAAENRLAVQKSTEELKSKADYIIENKGNKEQLIVQAKLILKLLNKVINDKK